MIRLFMNHAAINRSIRKGKPNPHSDRALSFFNTIRIINQDLYPVLLLSLSSYYHHIVSSSKPDRQYSGLCYTVQWYCSIFCNLSPMPSRPINSPTGYPRSSKLLPKLPGSHKPCRRTRETGFKAAKLVDVYSIQCWVPTINYKYLD